MRKTTSPEEVPDGPARFVIVRAGTTLAEAERLVIEAALARARSNVAAAAKELGLTPSFLLRWIRRSPPTLAMVGGVLARAKDLGLEAPSAEA